MKIKISIALVCLFFIVGCTQQTATIEFQPYKGTKNLEIEFMKNAPPNEINEERFGEAAELVASIKLTNEGADNIKGGTLAISYEDQYLYLFSDENKISFDLEGISPTEKYGDEIIRDFPFGVRQLEGQQETITTTLIATACYPYTTVFSDTVCIDTDLFDTRRESVCSTKDQGYSGQGTPVAVTSIATKSLGSVDKNSVRPVFEITIENKGDGTVLNEDTIEEACSSGPLTKEDWNKVYVYAHLLGRQLTCIPERNPGAADRVGAVQLKKGKGTAKCTLEEGIDLDTLNFNSLLTVELRYGYTISESKQVLIKKSNI